MSSQDGGFSDLAAGVGSAAGPAQVPAAGSSPGPASAVAAPRPPRLKISGTINDALATSIADRVISNIFENAGNIAFINVELWFLHVIHQQTPDRVKHEYKTNFSKHISELLISAQLTKKYDDYHNTKAIGKYLTGMRELAEQSFEYGQQIGKTDKVSDKKKSGSNRASNWAQTIRSITNDITIYGLNVYDAVLNDDLHQGLTRQIRMFDKNTFKFTREPSRQELIDSLKNKLKTKQHCFNFLHKCGLMPQAGLDIRTLRELCKKTFFILDLSADFDTHMN